MHRPVFFLDEPQHHHIARGGPLRFRGAALNLDGPAVDALRIVQEGRVVAETPVDKSCPELAFLSFPRAGTSRFDVTIEPGDARGGYELRAIFADGSEQALFRFANPPARDLWPCIDALPKPSPELVAATQGGGNGASYLDSMAAGVHTLENLLGASGVAAETLRSILDIGCGTGRLLMGWHCADHDRRLAGVDINAELIAWSKANLPGEWAVCDVLPPLHLGDAEFDLVQLCSVFTHLPLEHQKRWIEEIRRVLRPGGVLVITLHGAIYARLFGQAGEYSELPTGAIGSNGFASFHSRDFAVRLFAGFTLLRYFERGHVTTPPELFPIAALQDVYVFRKV